jgi:hypothetical protein
MTWRRNSSVMVRISDSVSMRPAETQLTRTPRPPDSLASERTMISTGALVEK